ncbi:MAG: lipopolysaccharide biosynthesis protein [Kastovskya adunca ATA6-11-RM4]|jgi:O-antigen/teichoic acid export membrane protein|nr:lipopolysaccharide biosynthesis protein [Kastovskya adunca ATA6-11-RM4]
MSLLQRTIDRIKHKLADRFVRNLGWLTGSEAVTRVISLLRTVILARFLTETDYGLAAIVLTVYEFTLAFTRIGVGAKLIQSDEKDLEELCISAYWLNWAVFAGLFVVQCLASVPIAFFYGNNQLIFPICIAATPLLIVPISAINYALIQRQNRFKVVALNNTIQLSFSSLFSALLAFLGFGMWAIVLPIVISAPIWVLIYYINHPWRPKKKFTTKRWGEILGFGKHLLGVQLLSTSRNYLDYLIVGRFVSIKELGIYFFAFNAGLGISLSIIKAIQNALLPHLSAVKTDFSKFKHYYLSSLKTIAIVIVPFVLLQSSLAPFYVPIVFGQKWVEAVPILVLICLSAIPRPFSEAASQLLIAFGRPDLDLRWNAIFTTVFIAAILIGVNWGAWGVAMSVLLIHLIAMPLFTMWATNYVFGKMRVLAAK